MLRRNSFYNWLLAFVIAAAATTAGAQSTEAAQAGDASAARDRNSLAEVRISASKLDQRTLNRVAMQFARSHGAANPAINQVGRWRRAVCPRVTGLQPAAGGFVARRVTEVARSVGAPTGHGAKGCSLTGEFASVEIVFTSEPQQLVDHLAKTYPVLLGSSRSQGDTSIRRAIQAWYLTGTRTVNGWSPLADVPPSGVEAVLMGIQAQIDASTPPGVDVGQGVRVDPAYGGGYTGSGLPGSHFSNGLTSEFLQVLIVVDSRKVTGYPLSAISDYIAMLALSRTGSFDGCNALSSIVDLLSSGCDGREKPRALTDADIVYLKALYSSDLETNLNLEQGDMRDRMVKTITGR